MLPCLSDVRVTSAHQRIPLTVQSFGSCNGIFDGQRAALCNHHRRIPKYAVSFEDWQRNGKADKTESGPGKRVIASLQSASFNIAPERARERARERVGSLAARFMFVVHESGAHVRRHRRNRHRRRRRATENANGTRGYFLTTIHRMARTKRTPLPNWG